MADIDNLNGYLFKTIRWNDWYDSNKNWNENLNSFINILSPYFTLDFMGDENDYVIFDATNKTIEAKNDGWFRVIKTSYYDVISSRTGNRKNLFIIKGYGIELPNTLYAGEFNPGMSRLYSYQLEEKPLDVAFTYLESEKYIIKDNAKWENRKQIYSLKNNNMAYEKKVYKIPSYLFEQDGKLYNIQGWGDPYIGVKESTKGFGLSEEVGSNFSLFKYPKVLYSNWNMYDDDIEERYIENDKTNNRIILKDGNNNYIREIRYDETDVIVCYERIPNLYDINVYWCYTSSEKSTAKIKFKKIDYNTTSFIQDKNYKDDFKRSSDIQKRKDTYNNSANKFSIWEMKNKEEVYLLGDISTKTAEKDNNYKIILEALAENIKIDEKNITFGFKNKNDICTFDINGEIKLSGLHINTSNNMTPLEVNNESSNEKSFIYQWDKLANPYSAMILAKGGNMINANPLWVRLRQTLAPEIFSGRFYFSDKDEDQYAFHCGPYFVDFDYIYNGQPNKDDDNRGFYMSSTMAMAGYFNGDTPNSPAVPTSFRDFYDINTREVFWTGNSARSTYYYWGPDARKEYSKYFALPARKATTYEYSPLLAVENDSWGGFKRQICVVAWKLNGDVRELIRMTSSKTGDNTWLITFTNLLDIDTEISYFINNQKKGSVVVGANQSTSVNGFTTGTWTFKYLDDNNEENTETIELK